MATIFVVQCATACVCRRETWASSSLLEDFDELMERAILVHSVWFHIVKLEKKLLREKNKVSWDSRLWATSLKIKVTCTVCALHLRDFIKAEVFDSFWILFWFALWFYHGLPICVRGEVSTPNGRSLCTMTCNHKLQKSNTFDLKRVLIFRLCNAFPTLQNVHFFVPLRLPDKSLKNFEFGRRIFAVDPLSDNLSEINLLERESDN